MSPKLFKMLSQKDLDKQQIKKDIVSGIIVAIIALPLSIALAISSGVSPEKGLITAIFAGFVISLLGGSKVQIGGPTGAFVVIVYGIVQQHGIDGLIIATIMAGIILIIMGVLRLGDLIKYVPKTITVGFTSGIAVTLLITQFKDFFGLQIQNVPAEALEKLECYIENINTFDIMAFIVGLACIILMIYWPKVNKNIPGSLIALIVATAVVKIFSINIDTIGSVYSNISSSIPAPSIPKVDIKSIIPLIQPAITIAILAAIESLLSCVVSDNMIDDTHDSNAELIAQGAGNIASALFGGIPATGAIARTAANVRSGGRSPISGIVHAVTLLLIMVILMPLAKLIPMTVLSAILIIVSYNMGEWKEMKEMLHLPKKDVIVLYTTFILTIVFDLVLAIGVGMAMHIVFNIISKSNKADDIDQNENLEKAI
ncbi:SulP family inorganic anion transporter [Romboutsia lituseburensis]|uniref:Sulfate permease, SulP family n=1 Tax=Romboutsia lituseburensis DSM 797 TaxID=1121325 RepID=A0A1G9KIL2_9FIRM|nr:SulP family inorganic anion transporter [Romboutsia lituseburensis]CEH34918.1 Sulfate transporter [Romboutsia lituseburensis]SDL49384.1 sulfate permease, SulP family [Romboutsia lituseburensis DSM 797]